VLFLMALVKGLQLLLLLLPSPLLFSPFHHGLCDGGGGGGDDGDDDDAPSLDCDCDFLMKKRKMMDNRYDSLYLYLFHVPYWNEHLLRSKSRHLYNVQYLFLGPVVSLQ